MPLTAEQKEAIRQQFVRKLKNEKRTTVLQIDQTLTLIDRIEQSLSGAIAIAKTPGGATITPTDPSIPAATIAGTDALKTEAGITAEFSAWESDYDDIVALVREAG